MGSKNSAYAGASGAHRLAWRPDSVAIITKNGGCSRECPPVLFGDSGKIKKTRKIGKSGAFNGASALEIFNFAFILKFCEEN